MTVVGDSGLSQITVKHRRSYTVTLLFSSAQVRTVVFLDLFKIQSVLCTGSVGISH